MSYFDLQIFDRYVKNSIESQGDFGTRCCFFFSFFFYSCIFLSFFFFWFFFILYFYLSILKYEAICYLAKRSTDSCAAVGESDEP